MTPRARPRNVALCYVRKSFTKSGEESVSPERQRDHIQRVIDAHGWKAEWYEDINGHKSGLQEKNRPEWLRLKARLKDSDVVAVIANDIARLHRKGWRIGDLLDLVYNYGVTLIMADPRRPMDFSTPQGRIFAQSSALFDEWYALDVSERQKSHAAHRKSQGKTCGMPPFGTERDKDGYLIPSRAGAWRLPDGSLIGGLVDDMPPVEGAIWRGYYDFAGRVLELYAQGNHGSERLTRQLVREGWVFKSRDGEPRPLDREDVRRIIGNYPEYGGAVPGTKSKERRFYEWSLVEFNPDRAVFDVDLLRRVESVRMQRTREKAHEGNRVDRRVYALQNLLFCSHCQHEAAQANNPKLMTRLGCQTASETLRYYRHKAGRHCGCKTRYIPMDELEGAFLRLVRTLTASPEDIAHYKRTMVNRLGNQDESDVAAHRQEQIALTQRRLDAAQHLYKDGEITREEYLTRRDEQLQALEYWHGYTTETEALVKRVTLSVETLNNLLMRWAQVDNEERNGMARSLFDYLVYDLDRRCFVDFRLKSWAQDLLFLRSDDSEGGDDDCIGLPHRGLEPLF